MLADCRDRVGLTPNDPSPRVAAALARDNDNLPLGVESAPVARSAFLFAGFGP
jgi:hypothetical protein